MKEHRIGVQGGLGNKQEASLALLWGGAAGHFGDFEGEAVQVPQHLVRAGRRWKRNYGNRLQHKTAFGDLGLRGTREAWPREKE